jgi:DNA-directed RNA polymerase subunit beta'
MLRKVEVNDPGDLPYLQGQLIDKIRIREENQRALAEGRRPGTFEPKLMGITRAALQSESFISAASFQETTKVLADASLAGRKDTLTGLKENVILGHLIPCGTGHVTYKGVKIDRLGEPVVIEQHHASIRTPVESRLDSRVAEKEHISAND